MRPEGVEPPAYRFEACRSIQLSYGRIANQPIAFLRNLRYLSLSLADARIHDQRSSTSSLCEVAPAEPSSSYVDRSSRATTRGLRCTWCLARGRAAGQRAVLRPQQSSIRSPRFSDSRDAPFRNLLLRRGARGREAGRAPGGTLVHE